MNLLKRTWETGAIPIGAPGWPEFAFATASAYNKKQRISIAENIAEFVLGMIIGFALEMNMRGGGEGGVRIAGVFFATTYRQNTNGVDTKIVKLVVSHCEKKSVDLCKSWVSRCLKNKVELE